MKPRSIGKTTLIMIALGIALGWATIFLIPAAVTMGTPAAVANNLPYLGLLMGLMWGFCLHFSPSAKAALQFIGSVFLIGSVFWFFALFTGGILVAMGVSPDVADYVPFAAFCLGAALASAPRFAAGFDLWSTLRARSADKQRE